MISQDGNTRDESKMRRPELKDRLQAAWDRIDALEQEVGRLREALRDCRQFADKLNNGKFGAFPSDIRRRAEIALNGGGGDQ